jgi:small-conductance mechanosensitive channel
MIRCQTETIYLQSTKEGATPVPKFLYYVFYNNTVLDYLIFFGCLVLSWTVIKIISHFIFRRLKKHPNKIPNTLLVQNIRKYLMPAAYFAAFYLNTKILVLSDTLAKIVNFAIVTFITVMGAIFVSSAAVLLFNKFWASKATDANSRLAVRMIAGLLKLVIWGVAIILFLDNIGVKINTLIAGVGIGGIAIAFAAQTILADIFCFFTIFFDRPFEIGDYIEAGEMMGTVEHIGVKTTRLRALSGEQLVCSNTDLTSSRIKNFKTMEQRRVLFTIRIAYDTEYERLKDIPQVIREAIENVPDTSFARTHFVSYGEYSLNFETAYYVLSSDYNKYLDIHQEINLRLKEAFEKMGISLALPVQSVYLHKPSGNTPENERLNPDVSFPAGRDSD